MSYLIVGLGVSGYAAASYLLAQNAVVYLYDDNPKVYGNNHIQKLLQKNGRIFNDEYSVINTCIFSPGIHLDHPLLERFRKEKVFIISEIEWALQKLTNFTIAVTGTNGKTTLCSSIAHILNYYNIKAKAVGNIGVPLSQYLLNTKDREVLIVELSSFQLNAMEKSRFNLGVIHNISPHHLDYHKTMEEYVFAKLRLQNFVQDTLYIGPDVAQKYKKYIKNYLTIPSNKWPKLSIAKENLDAVLSICTHFNIEKEECIRALATYRKSPYRLERVAKVQGITYYNDSKATNPYAVGHALENFAQPVILIAGGYNCLGNFSYWRKEFQHKIKRIIAMGQVAQKIYEELHGFFDVKIVKNLLEAFEVAKASAEDGDIILFSPGCPSYDAFKNFMERGEAFTQLVEGLKEEKI